MNIEAIDHLMLTAGDVAATCDFYSQALGMGVVTFDQGRTALAFGTQKINLRKAPGDAQVLKVAHPRPGEDDFCLPTGTPVAEWVEKFHELGIAIEQGLVRPAGALGPSESIYVRYPEGNFVEISNRVD